MHSDSKLSAAGAIPFFSVPLVQRALRSVFPDVQEHDCSVVLPSRTTSLQAQIACITVSCSREGDDSMHDDAGGASGGALSS